MTSEAAIIGPDREAESSTDPRDRVLLRARAGDVSAFEDLLRRHERLVFRTAWRLLGAAEDAEDAAQEVFLRLHRHLGRLDPARPLAAWLYRVTVNVCRSLGRRRRVRPSAPLESEAEALVDAGPGPGTAMELEDDWRMVARGLETLTSKERAALALHDLEGLTTREVAAALGVAEVTVRTHLSRARLKMRTFRERWLRRTSR